MGAPGTPQPRAIAGTLFTANDRLDLIGEFVVALPEPLPQRATFREALREGGRGARIYARLPT